MHKILVISDNKLLNQLYVNNLEVYLGAKVYLAASAKEATEKINKAQMSLIVSMAMISGKDVAADVYDAISSRRTKIPMMVIGKLTKEIENVIVIPQSYNLQNLIRTAARVLGVTAKEMAEMEMPEYYAIDNNFLKNMKEAPCGIYLKLNDGSYTIVAHKGNSLNDSVEEFLAQGINKLYVHNTNRLEIINAVSRGIVESLRATEGLETSQKSEIAKTGFEFVANSLGQSKEMSEEIMNIAKACTKVMEEIVIETPSLKKLMAILNSQRDGYVYTHSILAAYVSNHIIKRVSWGGESHIEKINFVLFFHDIMLAPIYARFPHLKYEEDLLFSNELSDKEKEVVLNHARLAAEMILTYKRAPIGADLLIKQHHGITNGIGFAVDFKDDVSPISKIVLVAEAFIEEFYKLRDQNPSYQLNVPELMEVLNSKFRRPTYKKIIETLKDFSA